MNGIVLKESATSSRVDHAGGCVDYQDPLDPDGPTDAPLTTSRRGLARLALVATEVGARFQREGVGHDPMAWMLASRRLFGGEAALDACLEREACLRAVLLHGLSLGLDAGPDQIGALLGDTPGDVGGGFWEGGDGAGAEPTRQAARRQRLFSTMIVFARGGELVHVFHASVAPSASVVRERIRARFGAAAASQADIRIGVDLSCPATSEMLPPAFRMMLERERRVRWAALSGLDVTVEHRIPS